MIQSDPKNPDILYNLGMCYSELGDFVASIKTLEQSLKFKPDTPNILTALSFSYIKAGRFKEAEVSLLRALEIDSNNLYAINNLAGFYGKMGHYDSAIKTLENGEKHFPEDLHIIYGLGLSNQKAGNFKKAHEYFKKLINRSISDDYTELGKTGLREIAEAEFKKKGLRPDAIMYCLAALQRFSKMDKEEIKKVTFEIALKGRSGFDTNDPSPQYQLISLPGNFSGLNLVCYMYVGFKFIAPGEDVGFDLSKEYETAKSLQDDPEQISWN